MNPPEQLESHGIKFGAHQNAYTSFEETVYELHVPADSPVLLERSLRVLRQLALEVRVYVYLMQVWSRPTIRVIRLGGGRGGGAFGA